MPASPAPRQLRDLPRWLWLWFPLAMVGLVLLAGTQGARLDDPIYSEFGVLENLTVLLLGMAVVLGIRIVLHSAALPHPGLRWWIVLLSLGCFYFAGEELSWGQHYAGWESSEFWQTVNRQQETNLHNIHGVFNEVPRLLMTVGALVGGIIVPVLVRFGTLRWSRRSVAYWLWPTYVCTPTCGLALLVTMPKKIVENTDLVLTSPTVMRAGEIKECLLALFLLLYLASIFVRLRQQAARGEQAAIRPVV